MTTEKPKEQTKQQVIRLSGKYLQAITAYVNTLILEEALFVRFNAEFDALTDLIANLHSAFMGPADVESALMRECFTFHSGCAGRVGPMTAPENADLASALIARLKDFFESLPRRYTLRIELPSFPPAAARKIELAEDVRLVYDGGTPLVNALMASAFGSMSYPRPGDRYLEIDAEGYGEHSVRSPAAAACISVAKQFLFVVTTHNICTSGFHRDSLSSALNDGLPGTFVTLSLPERLAKDFGGLALVESNLRVYESRVQGYGGEHTLLGDPGRPPEGPEEYIETIEQAMWKVKRYFRARAHPDFESIAAGIEWYQDSLHAENDTFGYIAACVGLEALLGSPGHVDNLSKRLADRYAFMLGGGRKDREAMISQYGKVLDVRGKLVHAKASRLRREDRHLLSAARQMLLNVIWHELQRVYREEAS